MLSSRDGLQESSDAALNNIPYEQRKERKETETLSFAPSLHPCFLACTASACTASKEGRRLEHLSGRCCWLPELLPLYSAVAGDGPLGEHDVSHDGDGLPAIQSAYGSFKSSTTEVTSTEGGGKRLVDRQISQGGQTGEVRMRGST